MGICNSSQRDKKINKNNVINKSCFKKIHPIGKGGFGTVRINIYNKILYQVWKIENQNKKIYYAMKEMSKVKIYQKKAINLIKNELTLLSNLIHTLI